jgi:hypothetical protein
MPPVEDQRRAAVTYPTTSAFSQLDHQLIDHASPRWGRCAEADPPADTEVGQRVGKSESRLATSAGERHPAGTCFSHRCTIIASAGKHVSCIRGSGARR